MTLLRKAPSKRDIIENFRSITLLNAELKILAKELAKKLVLVVDTQGVNMCHTNQVYLRQPLSHALHPREWGKEAGMGEALINLDKSEAFDRVDY